LLLAAAGLLLRSLIHLETLPPGFNPDGVMTAKASLADIGYNDPAAFRKLLDQSIQAMRAIPGVEDAAVGLTLPYERALLNGVLVGDGKAAGQDITSNLIYVSPGYFNTLQIPLLAGRVFTDADGPDRQPVAIVNQTFARKFLEGSSAVGRSISFPFLNRARKNTLIVGVVGDTVLSSAARLNAGSAPLTSEEAIYIPAAQILDRKTLAVTHAWFQPSWIVRAARLTEGLTQQMQLAMAGVDPNLPFSGFYDMKDLMAATLTTQRMEVALLFSMASLGLLLSTVGIFALVTNLVAQRTREIGVRMALGSTVREAMIAVGVPGMGAALLGLALGLILCAGALRTMRSVVYGVSVYDRPTILLVVVALSATIFLAGVVPVLKVARIDPAKTLREE
jgi:hypothetical protein